MLSRKAVKGDKLQQGRRNGSEMTQKGKLNTEMELTARILNLSDCTRDTHSHSTTFAFFYSFPWRRLLCLLPFPFQGLYQVICSLHFTLGGLDFTLPSALVSAII